MSGIKKMFSPPPMPALPAPGPNEASRMKRLPVETDPDILAAAQRTRAAALARKGRLSTILTDQTRDTIGSSGLKLGA